ncbi:hypothetical protein [Acinetobacter sp. ANC 4641]|uniref:hypothetical protein n=1 Tax=Acinetobacter sp. ANC 4641 TaxID=2529847 RepID=UPI001040784B|nr:hypothetical protein [Acinetobacter sp. ANC 4641]TCB11459.1 hypothetical protein E0H78_07450 [Acinetobacter sp. ANC 4641]
MRTELFNERIIAAQGAKHITRANIAEKKSLREQLENDVEKFLRSGGSVKTLSGIDFKPKQPSKPVERIKPWREVKQPEFAKSERNVKLHEWTKAKRDRINSLSKAMNVDRSYVANRVYGKVFVTAAEFEHEIKPAMAMVERGESHDQA